MLLCSIVCTMLLDSVAVAVAVAVVAVL